MQNYFENLEQAATEIHAANTAKGFWQPGVKRAISETIALAISELYEGLEAYRSGWFNSTYTPETAPDEHEERKGQRNKTAGLLSALQTAIKEAITI